MSKYRSNYRQAPISKYKHTNPENGEFFIGEKVGDAPYCFQTKTYGTTICLKRYKNGKSEYKWVEKSECTRV